MEGGGDINEALKMLPNKLKTELALHVNLDTLRKVTIFQQCSPEFLHDLVLSMRTYIFTPHDYICRNGEIAREMYIISDGILEVIRCGSFSQATEFTSNHLQESEDSFICLCPRFINISLSI